MKILKKCIVEKYFITTVVKYAFALGVTFFAYASVQRKGYLIAGCLELAIIFLVSNLMLLKSKKLGWVLNSLLLTLYNIQMGVLVFGNSYITLIMLDNIPSLDGLSGKIVLYGMAAALVLIIGGLPVCCFRGVKGFSNWYCPLSFVLCMELVFTMMFGANFSPMYGYASLLIQQYQKIRLERSIVTNANDTDIVQKFYKEEVLGYREKDKNLCKDPNVILIFTEGLSQHIVEDDRALMPNISNYEKKSLLFDNYYNHTFATYCGLISQLYSGYQLSNLDNNPLVSIQSILEDVGYKTSFINTEPKNKDFSNYLKELGFQTVIGDTAYVSNGSADSISDKDAYELLYETALEQHQEEKPFFTAIYTYGTHTSFDSPNEKYGDGQNAMLNKYYNLDFQFGKFMEKFEASELAKDTIVVFTTDHATYTDDSYKKTFPEETRATTTLDEIPFFIYYKGIEPEIIDVSGRNTVCLAPTILDYLDLSAPNYFVGSSLFATQANTINETSYYDLDARYTSKNCSVSLMAPEEQASFEEQVWGYFALKEAIQNKK